MQKNRQYLNFGIHNHQAHKLKCDVKMNQPCRWYIEIEVLDEVEKLYLTRVINPFKNKVAWIMKIKNNHNEYQYIKIMYTSKEYTLLPRFTKDTMYKEMEAWPKDSITRETKLKVSLTASAVMDFIEKINSALPEDEQRNLAD